MNEYRIGTKCVQGGYTPGNGEQRQIPIVQSTTFKYATSEGRWNGSDADFIRTGSQFLRTVQYL